MKASTSKSQELLTALYPYFMDIVEQAPQYGSCGIDIVFHAGRPVRIEKKIGISVQPPETQVKRQIA
jgi:hypothetical protein